MEGATSMRALTLPLTWTTAVGSSWQGAAATQFQSLMNQWHENATKVNRALQDLADNLRATDSSMTHNESETESSFTTLLGGMQ